MVSVNMGEIKFVDKRNWHFVKRKTAVYSKDSGEVSIFGDKESVSGYVHAGSKDFHSRGQGTGEKSVG